MNIVEAFADFLENELQIATFGQDLFIGEAPSSNKTAQIPIWWLIGSGGQTLIDNQTNEKVKQYTIEVYHRNRNYKTVYDEIYTLEEELNCDGCTQLEGFDTIDISTIAFPIDNDLDSESRKIGLLQVNITVYKSC